VLRRPVLGYAWPAFTLKYTTLASATTTTTIIIIIIIKI
jgi:hypothetical protein